MDVSNKHNIFHNDIYFTDSGFDDIYITRRRVPAFGSWDFDNTEYLSYTQCFETERPGRLLRNSFSGYRDRYNGHEVFAPSRKIRRQPCPSCKISLMSAEPPQVMKNGRWFVGEAISNNPKNSETKVNSRSRSRPRPMPTPVISVSETKAIDEDLYTISPELLREHTTKRTKVWGIFSSCIHPKCSH